MFISTPHSYVEILFSNIIVSGGGVFRRCLGLKGEVLMNGTTVLIKLKDDPESSFSFSFCKDPSRKSPSMNQDMNPHVLNLPAPSQPLEQNYEKFLLFISHPGYEILL